MTSAIGRIKWNRSLPKWHVKALKDLRRYGYKKAVDDLKFVPIRIQRKIERDLKNREILLPNSSKTPLFDSDIWRESLFLSPLGDVLLRELSPKGNYFPYYDFMFTMDSENPHGLLLSLSSLQMLEHRGGCVYYSQFRPCVLIEGKNRLVTFSSHAIDQLFLSKRRHTSNCESYLGLGDCHGLLQNFKYYEVEYLSNNKTDVSGQPALVMFEPMVNNYWHEDYAQHMVPEGTGKYLYIKYGYCPLAVYDEYVVAVTFILPGFQNTPEYQLRINEKGSGVENTPSATSANKFKSDSAREKLMHGELDWEFLKWAHKNGIPQIKRFERPIDVPSIYFKD